MARKMKDSGIEWIGEIPETWGIIKLKYIGSLSANGVDKKIRDGEIKYKSVHYMDVYSNSLREIGNSDDYLIISATNEKATSCTLEKGDVLFTNSSETPNDMGHSTVIAESLNNTLFGYHLMRLRPTIDIELGFEKYLFGSHYMRKWFEYRSNGITRYGITYKDFAVALVILPPLEEQKAIADYLNRKCFLIDSIIEKQKAVIEKLKLYKQSIITETVTKGLDPTVKMKPSGIEWIGDIPWDWNIKRLRYIGNCQNGISKSAEYFGEGYPFVSYGDVYRNIELPLKVEGLVNSLPNERTVYSVKGGDIFFTRTSETIEEIGLASTCMQTIEDATFAGFLIRFRPMTAELNKKFSKYYFRSEIHRRFFVKEMNLVTRASLSQELLKKLPVLVPPIEEQVRIASYLDDKCNRIDQVLNKKQAAIDKLTNYKKSLIYECVTGKREVG